TIAASVFFSSVPAYRGTYQASAWHEAKLAADAGADFAMSTLQKTVPNPALYDWNGWTIDLTTGAPVPAGYDGIRYYTPPASTLVNGGDGSTRPQVSRIEIDVVTRDDNYSQNAWYRIRSTGMAEVASSQLGLDPRDLSLRRMTLQKKRVGGRGEVLSRPVYLWEYALKTTGSMTLGGGRDWVIDSYDSRYWLYPDRSVNGIYDSSISRSFGNIASNQMRPLSSPYGVIIDAEGAVVKGEVQTNGGDDPNTQVHENVEESDGIDQKRITDEYSETLTAKSKPTWYADVSGVESYKRTTPSVQSGTTAEDGGSVNTPHKVRITAKGGQRVGGFEVVNSTPGNDRVLDIYVDGDVDLNGSQIQVQKG